MNNANTDRSRYTVKMIASASMAQLVKMEEHAAYHAENFAEIAADAQGDELATARIRAAKYGAICHLITARLRELRGEFPHTVQPLRSSALETLARIKVAVAF